MFGNIYSIYGQDICGANVFFSLYSLIDNPEEWRLTVFYAFFGIFFTIMDIIEIRAAEKKWFDAEERED